MFIHTFCLYMDGVERVKVITVTNGGHIHCGHVYIRELIASLVKVGDARGRERWKREREVEEGGRGGRGRERGGRGREMREGGRGGRGRERWKREGDARGRERWKREGDARGRERWKRERERW